MPKNKKEKAEEQIKITIVQTDKNMQLEIEGTASAVEVIGVVSLALYRLQKSLSTGGGNFIMEEAD